MISERAKKIKSSPTLALAAKAKELAAQGHDVISLSVGEPDWDTFEVGNEAAIEAIKSGFTKYTPANGIPELRKAIAKQLKVETGVDYTADQVTVTSGGKFVIHSVINTVVNPGDEVIIAAPYWVSYPTIVEMAEGKPVIVSCGFETAFKMTGAQLRKALTPKTKMVILNSPSNPTGEMYSVEELRDLANVLIDFPNVLIMSDDIYNRLVFTNDSIAPHILKVEPKLKDRTIVVNGASKSYSMTGWRIGWAAGPLDIIKAMNNFQSQTVSNANSIAQKAALASLEKGEPELRNSVKLLKSRLDFGLKELEKIPGIKIKRPDGAFYLWLDVSSYLGKTLAGRTIKTSSDFSAALLDEKKVAVVPGVEFGAEGFIRMSYALNENRMGEAFKRLADFLK